MKDAQERMDKGAAMAANAEIITRELASLARAGADEACKEGDAAKDSEASEALHEFSANLRSMASDFEMAAAYLGRGYAKGRAMAAGQRIGDK
jgi:hypothetical protein